MFIKNNEKLPPNIIWIIEDKAKNILNCFPEISRRVNSKGFAEIAFIDSKELRDKIKEIETEKC